LSPSAHFFVLQRADSTVVFRQDIAGGDNTSQRARSQIPQSFLPGSLLTSDTAALPGLRIFHALCRRSFLAQGHGHEPQPVLALLPGLRAGDLSRSASPGDYPLTSYPNVNPTRFARRSPESSPSDGAAKHIHNEILCELPRQEFLTVSPKVELVRLQPRQVLHDAGDTLKSLYFCNTGIISILSVLSDGKTVEVGLVGKEGLVGLPLIAGFSTSATRSVVQIEGTALRIDGEALTVILPQCPRLERKLQQFAQIMTMQATQIAACNRLHEVEERLARWLLMSADRTGTNSLPLTQEVLAQMLGARRSSVTVAAGILQKAGLISYTRGDVRIIHRAKLERAACECYGLMQRQVKLWRAQAG
jgi:CRP-like cAMP-binding protein